MIIITISGHWIMPDGHLIVAKEGDVRPEGAVHSDDVDQINSMTGALMMKDGTIRELVKNDKT